MSKRQQINSQKAIIEHLSSRLENAIRELRNFDRGNNRLREELKDQSYYWTRRLRDAEEMFKLRTANLEKHNQALGDLIIRDAALRLNPMIVFRPGHVMPMPDCALYCERLQKEIGSQLRINARLTKEVNDMKNNMKEIASDLLAKSI